MRQYTVITGTSIGEQMSALARAGFNVISAAGTKITVITDRAITDLSAVVGIREVWPEMGTKELADESSAWEETCELARKHTGGES